ncbi:MAG: MerR family transcriptional regulator [Firmicutes bacterium]|nr:MerR family transcriptional regulator [Bacillota bacterium]
MTERLWFKIGETARLVGATPKELRYWEQVIPELKPRRSKGNLRYYHQEELANLQRIRQWLNEGLTVVDCRARLLGAAPGVSSRSKGDLGEVVEALQALHQRLSRPVGEKPAKVIKAKKPRHSQVPVSDERPVSSKPKVEPKAESKPKAEPSPLGRMWSQLRLPLDWDDL